MGCFHSKEAVAQETLETAFEQPLSFPHNSDAGVKYAVDGKVQSLQVNYLIARGRDCRRNRALADLTLQFSLADSLTSLAQSLGPHGKPS